MSIILRIALLLGALLSMLYMLRQIRQSRLRIELSVFWSLFSGALVILAIFPNILIDTAKLMRFESPANALFLIIIFILIMRLFSMTLQISRMESQMQRMAQHIALHEASEAKELKKIEGEIEPVINPEIKKGS